MHEPLDHQPVKSPDPSPPRQNALLDSAPDVAQQYLNIAGIMMVALDESANITLLNRKAYEVIEHPEGNLIGRNWIEMFVPERNRAEVTSVFHQGMAGATAANSYHENTIVTRSGRERVIGWHNTLLKDENDKCIGTLSFGEDITDRKLAEAALRESEERFRGVVETSPDAISLITLDGRIVVTNRRAAVLGGFDSVEDLLASGKNCFEVLPPDERDRARADILRLVESNVVRNAEYCIVHADGSRHPVEVSAALVKDSTGNPSSLICIVRDIADRKRAEEAVAAADRDWSACFDAMSDAVSLHGPDHTILNANQSLCDLVGKTKEHVIGAKCYQVFHGLDAPIPGCPLVQSRETLRRENTEVFEPTLGKWLAASTSPVLDEHGGLARLVHVVRDVTLRKEFESQLATARDQAIAANQAKSEFLANMSHEIRTPMTAILGFTDLLMSPNLSPDEQRDFLKTIERNGRALLALINDILDLSKIEADKMSAESVDCSLRQLVDDVLVVVRGRAESKGLSLNVLYEPSLPTTIRTDPTRLRQILVNLVGNAIKFTEQGGVTLAIRSRKSDVGNSQMQFAITDTGIGIEPDVMSELFQPFTQADASTTRCFGGTGLGLAISKRLAKLLGGDIEVYSKPGHGSTFTLTVDVEHAIVERPREGSGVAAADQEPNATKAAAPIQGRILVAEDTPNLQKLLSHVLLGMTATIEIADNGRSACEQAMRSKTDGKPFDLILMDIQMPDMDGLEATRWLRDHGWQGPIVALTAYSVAGDRDRCLTAGCDDYLAKTLHLQELRTMVARYLDGNTAANSSKRS